MAVVGKLFSTWISHFRPVLELACNNVPRNIFLSTCIIICLIVSSSGSWPEGLSFYGKNNGQWPGACRHQR